MELAISPKKLRSDLLEKTWFCASMQGGILYHRHFNIYCLPPILSFQDMDDGSIQINRLNAY